MESIKLYKCSFCGKIHIDENECMDHEKGCFENTKIKSCRNCVFFRISTLQFDPGDSVSISTCLRNVDNSENVVSNCDKYLANNTAFGDDILIQAEGSYNPFTLIIRQIKELFPHNESVHRYTELPF